jgi:hypothetical protein
MNTKKMSNSGQETFWRSFIVLFVVLLVVFSGLFYKSFLQGQVLFANDFPLGAAFSSALHMPGQFSGVWSDLNWLGLEGGSAPVDISMMALWMSGPVFYAKFWQPLSLIFLGLCAWVFCRSLKLSPVACVLCGLASALHPDFFSMACWGQVSRPMALGAMFLALSALQNGAGWRGWLRTGLAGMAVGLGIMEGFDVAVLFSLAVGAYIIYQAWVEGSGSLVKRTSRGGLRLLVVAGFAAFLAFQSLSSLVGTNIKGVAGAEQDTQTRLQKWDWATQWSLPKAETLSWVVSGLYGHRMDTPDGGQYWGGLGRDPAWDRYFESGMRGQPPQGLIRYGGENFYGGIFIVVIGLWALLQSFRRGQSPFSSVQRKLIWFWAGLGAVCVFLAWGRFAPFYKLFYLLPYASTIRNPCKFMHLVDWAALVVFAYGVHDLSRRMIRNPMEGVRGLAAQWKQWRSRCSTFDRRWVAGSVATVCFALLGWSIYASSGTELEVYLGKVQFDSSSAAEISEFSIRQVGWFVVFLAGTLGAIALVLSGYFSGKKANVGIAVLGLILLVDLGRSNLPWIIHWDYSNKYSTNPIIERLAVNAFQQRVAIVPEWILGAFRLPPPVQQAGQVLSQLYRTEWAQHHFAFNNIQSLDVTQMPRQPVDFVAYEGALQVHSDESITLLTRKWELTNTRYVLGVAGVVDLLNKKFDPGKERFRIVERFNVAPKLGISRPVKLEDLTVERAANGSYALIEFAGALARVGLYTNWKVSTNDAAALQILKDPAFDPARIVLVSDTTLTAAEPGVPQSGRAEIKSYKPKQILIEAQTDVPAILLLNDRFSPNWQVRVDGKQAPLLRCNYLMRGVFLTSGVHRVEFIFSPSMRPLYISLSALVAGMLMLLILFVRKSAKKS